MDEVFQGVKYQTYSAEDWDSEGDMFFSKENYKTALECYKKSNKIRPITVKNWNKKYDKFYSKNQYNEALACCEVLIKLEPYNSIFLEKKGDILSQQKKYNDAIICYKKIIGTILANLGVYYKLAGIYCDNQNYDAAIEVYKKIAEIYPNEKKAHENLSRLYLKQKKYEEVVNCYVKLHEINSNDFKTWNYICLELKIASKNNELLKYCHQLIEISKTKKTYTDVEKKIYLGCLQYMAELYFEKKNYDEVLKCYEELGKLTPADLKTLIKKANILMLKKNYNTELIYCIVAPDTNFVSGDHNNVKGVISFCEGKFEEALKHFSAAIDCDDLVAGFWKNKGNTYYHLGDYLKAVKCYEKAIEIDPELKLDSSILVHSYQQKKDIELEKAKDDNTDLIEIVSEFAKQNEVLKKQQEENEKTQEKLEKSDDSKSPDILKQKLELEKERYEEVSEVSEELNSQLNQSQQQMSQLMEIIKKQQEELELTKKANADLSQKLSNAPPQFSENKKEKNRSITKAIKQTLFGSDKKDESKNQISSSHSTPGVGMNV